MAALDFVKLTDEGIVGWSECSDSHGSPKGIEGVVNDLSKLLIGQNPLKVNKILYFTQEQAKSRFYNSEINCRYRECFVGH